jgi:hypothetical protein
VGGDCTGVGNESVKGNKRADGIAAVLAYVDNDIGDGSTVFDVAMEAPEQSPQATLGATSCP